MYTVHIHMKSIIHNTMFTSARTLPLSVQSQATQHCLLSAVPGPILYSD